MANIMGLGSGDSGGSGGGVETVTLNVIAGGIPMWNANSVFATGINGVFEITDYGIYDVVKNSMLFVESSVMYTNNLTRLYFVNNIQMYEVIGNSQIDLG